MIPAFDIDNDGRITDLAIPGEGRVLVRCAVCQEIIGAVYLEELSLPLKTEMFKSPDPLHGFPVPFRPGFGHEAMFCPICRGKAIAYPGDVIRTDKGEYRVPEKEEKAETIDPLPPPNFMESHFVKTPLIEALKNKESQGRAEVAHLVHTQEAAGSIPAPATNNATEGKKGPSCPICGKVCGSLPGLQSHLRSHKKEEETR